MKLPMQSVLLGCVGWLPFSVVIPLGMEMMAGPVPRGVVIQISVAFAVTGLIAIITHYYVVSYIVIRVLYTRLFGEYGSLDDVAAHELSAIPGRNRLFQVLAGLTPLSAATVLLLIGPDQFSADSFGRFRMALIVLIGLGIAGFGLATTVTSQLAHIVSLITGAQDRRAR